MQELPLDPDSHRALVERVAPRLKRVVFGPPIVNVEKLHALARAGVVRFDVARGGTVVTDEATGRFRVGSPSTGGPPVEVEVLIDGRYPAIDLERDATPLYRNLLARGLVRPHEIAPTEAGEAPYRPGAIDYDRETGAIVARDGRVDPRLTVLGIPTEGRVLGNFTIVAGDAPGRWAARVVRALRDGDDGVPSSPSRGES